jgi:hypothetical protein
MLQFHFMLKKVLKYHGVAFQSVRVLVYVKNITIVLNSMYVNYFELKIYYEGICFFLNKYHPFSGFKFVLNIFLYIFPYWDVSNIPYFTMQRKTHRLPWNKMFIFFISERTRFIFVSYSFITLDCTV